MDTGAIEFRVRSETHGLAFARPASISGDASATWLLFDACTENTDRKK